MKKLPLRFRIKDKLAARLFNVFVWFENLFTGLAHRVPLYTFREAVLYAGADFFYRLQNAILYNTATECDLARTHTHDEIPDEELSRRALDARYGRDQ